MGKIEKDAIWIKQQRQKWAEQEDKEKNGSMSEACRREMLTLTYNEFNLNEDVRMNRRLYLMLKFIFQGLGNADVQQAWNQIVVESISPKPKKEVVYEVSKSRKQSDMQALRQSRRLAHKSGKSGISGMDATPPPDPKPIVNTME